MHQPRLQQTSIDDFFTVAPSANADMTKRAKKVVRGGRGRGRGRGKR
jgi:hypothetical protein